ncbi:MAG TPA: 3-phosphoshikimate 1-carboxyvinyltransferase [Clostridiales bacterium]|nr:3-phosphoshikimate 1-carboxyvinyltransferase [Clostridiales bacterium]
MEAVITPARQLIGEVDIPGDKSISHRGVMLGSLAKGTTRITHFLTGEDCLNTIKAFQSMGVSIETNINSRNETEVIITGKGLHGLNKPASTIDVGNSGTTARLLSGILAGQSFSSVLDGDASLRKRPMGRVVEPLAKMGAIIHANDGKLPLNIYGSELHGIEYSLPVASAQVKSAIILAALYADSPAVIHQNALSRDHTEIMINFFGGKVETRDLSIHAHPVNELYARDLYVPGDISSAAFFITAALLVPNSRITMKKVGINPTRTGILDVYRQMGADIKVENIDYANGEPMGDLTASYSLLRGVEIEGAMIPRLIDEIPIIALAASQAHGTTVIRDAAELKVKESNRIDMVVRTLRTLGADIEATEDGMVIHGPAPLTGNIVSCGMDHRIAMMAAIAGLIARDRTIIADSQWVDISFPGFFNAIERLK